MNETIKEYVESCQHCQDDKARRHKRYGLLLPTETPYKPWDSISMDFITDLPASEGHTEIVTETLMGREGDTLRRCACNPGPPSGAPVKRGDHIPEAH